jgi:phosphotriesterase-related protein
MVHVRTVTGMVPAESLGTVLFHEHVITNNASAWRHPSADETAAWELVDPPVTRDLRPRLAKDPYVNKDNCSLNDPETAIEELRIFSRAGGTTVIDQTTVGIGRNPRLLREISDRSGVRIVMGAGYYLERSHPPHIATSTIDDITEQIVNDIVDGVDGVHAGLIGEIGIGPQFTAQEDKVLRAAARAQVLTGVPLSVHLPGWQRLGDRVIEVAAEEGCQPRNVVLCHMNPAGHDGEYLHGLADAGAWLSFDMLGMDHQFPGEGASPADEQNAVAVARLVDAGYAEQILLSHDVFIKTLLSRYGGPGYAHVLTDFLPRLKRHGVSASTASSLLTVNPRAVFEAAAQGETR